MKTLRYFLALVLCCTIFTFMGQQAVAQSNLEFVTLYNSVASNEMGISPKDYTPASEVADQITQLYLSHFGMPITAETEAQIKEVAELGVTKMRYNIANQHKLSAENYQSNIESINTHMGSLWAEIMGE